MRLSKLCIPKSLCIFYERLRVDSHADSPLEYVTILSTLSVTSPCSSVSLLRLLCFFWTLLFAYPLEVRYFSNASMAPCTENLSPVERSSDALIPEYGHVRICAAMVSTDAKKRSSLPNVMTEFFWEIQACAQQPGQIIFTALVCLPFQHEFLEFLEESSCQVNVVPLP